MVAAEWPLTCRDDELRRVVDAVRATGGAVLAGPAGVGKTRLAREALGVLAGPRGRFRWAVASVSAQAVPLGAFATFIGAELDGQADATLVGRAAAVLRDGASVVGVDDTHLLDGVSAALLLQLATQRTVPLVVTVRTGEDAPDAVTALWKDGFLERIEIAPLTEQQTADVLASGLGGPVDMFSVRRLFEATQGNTLWLRQLVGGELTTGRLALAGGVWHWNGDPQLSPALSDLIRARIGWLSSEAREVLELLAVGEPIELDMLNELTDPGAVETSPSAALSRWHRPSVGWPSDWRIHCSVRQYGPS